MTVGSQVKQTLASLKGAQSTMETIAAVEKNQEAKEILEDSARRLEEVIGSLQERVRVLEFEEPQYKGF